MTKRILTLLLALLLLFVLCLPAAAFPTSFLGGDDDADEAEEQTFIHDNAGLLKDRERNKLEDAAEELADEYDCGVYVLTVGTMNGARSRAFSENYYLENGLGIGDYRNGILFFICMDTRDYITITYGQHPTRESKLGIGRLAFSDKGVEYLEEEVVPFLSDGDYNDAFERYVELCGEYLEYYDEHEEPKEPLDTASLLLRLAIVILAPLLLAFIVCMIFRAQMKTANIATEAGDYISEGSFVLTRETDRYTHTTRTREKISSDSNSSGSGGSGSGSFGGSKGGKF